MPFQQHNRRTWSSTVYTLQSATGLLTFCDVPLPGTNTTLLYDTLTGQPCLFIPAEFCCKSLILYTQPRTQVFEQPSDSPPRATSGHASTPTCAIGPSNVFSANAPRSNVILPHHLVASQHQIGILTTSMCILPVPYHIQTGTAIY